MATRYQALRLQSSLLSSRSARAIPVTHMRTYASSSTPPRGEPISQDEPKNEALEYLANKAARKQQRKADPTSARARHASFYTDILPALLRVLAYGSSAYFGLHLLWNLLDRDEQRQLMNQQTDDIQTRIHSVTQKVRAATATKE